MMSVCKKQNENDLQNLLQTNQKSKNFSEFKLPAFKRISGIPKITGTRVKENQTEQSSSGSDVIKISGSSSSTSSSQAEENEIIEWRRAVTEDKNNITKLQTFNGEIPNLLFPNQNTDELIEKSYFPIVQFDSKGDLVSFSVYDSYPNIPTVPVLWSDWLTINYEIKGVNSGNVLFVHYMVWGLEHKKKFLPILLKTLFSEFLHLKYIIIVKPPKVQIPDFFSDYFIPVFPSGLEKLENNSIQLLLVCLRSSVIRPLYIRSAFEQELDVIATVFKSQTKNEKSKNSSYVWDFVNILYKKDMKALICEIEKQMAGIMIINVKIDLNVLNEEFELTPFNGLRKKKFNIEEKFDDQKPSVYTQLSNKTQKDTNFLMSSEILFSQMNWEMMLNKIKPSSSSVEEQNSSTSSSVDSQYSEFSFLQLSSIINLNKSEASEVSFQAKSDQFSKIGDVNVIIQTSGSDATHFFPPKYLGDSNAFVIDFFAINCSKINEKLCAFDFLDAAFKKVPDKEYCVILIPTDLLPFPLLDLFVRVTPRPGSSTRQELYLCHKNSLFVTSMSVKNTEKEDLDVINDLLKNVNEGDIVYEDILKECFEENNNFKSFVLTVEEEIVGVSLINSQDDIENYYMSFEISDYTPTGQNGTSSCSVIKHLVLNPMYQSHARFFVRDIMRLADVNCLYYPYENSKNRCNLLTILKEFVPIKPKRKVKELYYTHYFINSIIGKIMSRNHFLMVEFNTLTPNIPFSSNEEKSHENSFGLYFLSPRLCSFHKIHINIVIVVVGSSRTALSFLESLIFGPESCFYNYNNLICVTPHGLEKEGSNENLKNLMFPIRDNFSRKYFSMLSLEAYVSFIYGIMTEINRSDKYIVVNNRVAIKYDYLILTCGLQYITPTPKAKEDFKNQCRNKFKGPLARFLIHSSEQKKIYIPKHPINMFIINTNKDAQNAIRALQFLMLKTKNVQQNEKKIIVYGHDLHVFLTINTLLKLGIPGEFIVFVEPFPSGSTTVTLFNDYSVDQAVLESVKQCKVNYYTDYFLYDWTISTEDCITALKFHSKHKQIVIPCLAFFPFLEKFVSDVTSNACREAGLVYDGKLVINHNFRTNDKSIYAAGPLTKYARRYYASDRNHQYYNSREVGQKLAEIIKKKIDPTGRNITEEESDLVPLLKAPLIFYCQLPGDFNLFILRKPGKELDLETAYNYYDYGEVLTTGDCQMKNGFGYFRLHINQEGFVESITCFTKDKIDYLNLCSLYGLHEKILNNLLLRYDMALIPDLFEYFRQPWAQALFHENFQQLRECNFAVFTQKTFNGKSFRDKVAEELKSNNWHSLPPSTKDDLEIDFLNSVLQEDIRNNLMKFLECYKDELPIYAIPSTLKRMLNERLNI